MDTVVDGKLVLNIFEGDLKVLKLTAFVFFESDIVSVRRYSGLEV